MDAPDPVLDSLRRAVAAQPDDVALRLHLAALLLSAGRTDEAVAACAVALQQEPGHSGARELMARAMSTPLPIDAGSESRPPTAGSGEEIDWVALDAEFGDVAEPMFVAADKDPAAAAWRTEQAEVTLRDVGGMSQVKERLEAAFLAPLRNPGLRELYGKRLGGGMLLWGPPGCGKTFLARAVAGEMGARFISVGLTDVLDMYVGSSERNLHELFELARREAPVVVFLDEIDALGQKRSLHRSSGMRGQVNQLLTELDGVDSANDGVFVLAATNQPWDVDPALRRPGRLDRMLLVLPPDRGAREAIFRYHLRHRPVAGIDLGRLAKLTEGYSGADIAHICETASERALLDSVRTGEARLISMVDVQRAAAEVRPSTGPWFDSARNTVLFASDEDTYGELRTYMRRTRRL
ncbi:MAG TPA: ATP-binding protein [Propionibacteriaceae bacterium]|nr:ATP-binding protein [Propionibacteriaceae bacterium]